MTRQKFLIRLSDGLKGLSDSDIAKALEYYNEIISDRMDEGLAEEEAVSELGDINSIIKQIKEEYSFNADSSFSEAEPSVEIVDRATKYNKPIRNKKGLEGYQIVLIVLTFPFWLPILITLAAIIFAAFVVIWSVTLALLIGGIASCFGGIWNLALSIYTMFTGSVTTGLFNISEALILLGVALIIVALIKVIFRLAVKASKGIISLISMPFKGGRA